MAEIMNRFSEEERKRYDRQIMLDDLGYAGQAKLKDSRVSIVGVGGLGSSVSYYLSAAGVGNLTLFDCDVVDISNLNRQILHWEKNLGEKKVDSALAKLAALNPAINISIVSEKITGENSGKLLQGSHLIIDCLDNFPTRFVLNEASLSLGIPLLHGACRGFEGRVSLLIPGKTPCLGCIIREAPPPEKFPILGVTAGIIGTIQATEAIKFICGINPLMENKLLIYDGKAMYYRLIEIEKDPECRYCGKEPQK